jgi:hypothetical protein
VYSLDRYLFRRSKIRFAAALKQPVTYHHVEWWDRAEGALPNPDVQYPEPERAGAFLCSDRRLFRYKFLAGQDQQLAWTGFGGQAQMRVLLRLIWE